VPSQPFIQWEYSASGHIQTPAELNALQGDCLEKPKLIAGWRLGWSLLFFLPVARVLLVLLALLALLALLTLLTLLALLLAIHVLRTLCGLLVRFLIAIRTVLFHLVMVFHC
jgi:hypothetical protein